MLQSIMMQSLMDRMFLKSMHDECIAQLATDGFDFLCHPQLKDVTVRDISKLITKVQGNDNNMYSVNSKENFLKKKRCYRKKTALKTNDDDLEQSLASSNPIACVSSTKAMMIIPC